MYAGCPSQLNQKLYYSVKSIIISCSDQVRVKLTKYTYGVQTLDNI